MQRGSPPPPLVQSPLPLPLLLPLSPVLQQSWKPYNQAIMQQWHQRIITPQSCHYAIHSITPSSNSRFHAIVPSYMHEFMLFWFPAIMQACHQGDTLLALLISTAPHIFELWLLYYSFQFVWVGISIFTIGFRSAHEFVISSVTDSVVPLSYLSPRLSGSVYLSVCPGRSVYLSVCPGLSVYLSVRVCLA